MLLYSNHTPFSAILTLKIEGSEDPAVAVMIGTTEFLEKVAAKLGYHDFLIGSGKELHVSEGTVALLLGVRGAS